jgi:hypothetical protein
MLHRSNAERQLWHERSCVQSVCRPEHNKDVVLLRFQSDAEVAGPIRGREIKGLMGASRLLTTGSALDGTHAAAENTAMQHARNVEPCTYPRQ